MRKEEKRKSQYEHDFSVPGVGKRKLDALSPQRRQEEVGTPPSSVLLRYWEPGAFAHQFLVSPVS